MRLTDTARPRAFDATWGMLPGNPLRFGGGLPQIDGPAHQRHPPPLEGIHRHDLVDRNRLPLAFAARIQAAQQPVQQQHNAVHNHQQDLLRRQQVNLMEDRQAAVRAEQLQLARRIALRDDMLARRRRAPAPRAARR